MNNEQIKATEASLKNYYLALEDIEHNKCILERLIVKLDRLKENKKTYKNIFIDPDLNMGINMSSEKVQTSGTGTSYAEREFIKQETWLEEKITDTGTEISKLEAEIEDRETGLINIEHGIKDAIKNCYGSKELIEMRYRDRKPLEEIAEKLNMTKSNVEYAFKKDNGILDCISRWVRNNKDLKVGS